MVENRQFMLDQGSIIPLTRRRPTGGNAVLPLVNIFCTIVGVTHQSSQDCAYVYTIICDNKSCIVHSRIIDAWTITLIHANTWTTSPIQPIIWSYINPHDPFPTWPCSKHSLPRRFSLIQGPPGTGKTTTAAAIICGWLKSNRGPVLASAFSNKGCDNIAWRGDSPSRFGGDQLQLLGSNDSFSIKNDANSAIYKLFKLSYLLLWVDDYKL